MRASEGTRGTAANLKPMGAKNPITPCQCASPLSIRPKLRMRERSGRYALSPCGIREDSTAPVAGSRGWRRIIQARKRETFNKLFHFLASQIQLSTYCKAARPSFASNLARAWRGQRAAVLRVRRSFDVHHATDTFPKAKAKTSAGRVRPTRERSPAAGSAGQS